jgi:hypothetical protein
MCRRVPGQLVIQITDRCNARCPQCGMRVNSPFARSTLATDTIKRMIDAAARQGVRAISFTGGEPLLDIPRLVELIRYAGSAVIPFIRTGTNGFLFTGEGKGSVGDRVSRIADQLADTPLRNFWISLDSAVDEVQERMRGFPGVVAGIANALPIFHRAGIYPAVNLGINRMVGGEATAELPRTDADSEETYLDRFYRRYRSAFEAFYRRAVDLGFTMANTCYPMSIEGSEACHGLSAVYGATAADAIVRFSPAEKRVLFDALAGAIGRFRHKIRIFTPLCSLQALVRQYGGGEPGRKPYGCRGGTDFFYVNAADGHLYPCGYRGGEDHGQLWDMDIRRIRPPEDADACRRCDWECFRDPSEMLGPLIDGFSHPFSFALRLLRDQGGFHPGGTMCAITMPADILTAAGHPIGTG